MGGPSPTPPMPPGPSEPIGLPATRPVGSPRAFRAARGFTAGAMALAFWVVVLLMAIPASASPFTPATAPSAAVPVLQLPEVPGIHRAAPSATSGAAMTLPGSTPSGLAEESGAVPAYVPPIYQTLANASESSSLAATSSAPAAQSAIPSATPTPASGIVTPSGFVSGTVCAQGGGNPCTSAVEGVAVQAYSNIGGDCPTCTQVTTNINGNFTARCPAGADYATFTLSFWVDNETYFKCLAGTTVYVGIVYLVAEAIGTGYVYSNITNTPALSGVAVSAISRDQQVHGNPAGTTSSSGYFKIGIPPLPSQITFQPPPGYLGTFLYANATPGQVVNLGKIYLQKLVPVKATLYDITTGNPVPTTSGCNPYDPQCRAISVCSAVTNICASQGDSVMTPQVEAVAAAGPSFIKALATGFEATSAPIGTIPWNPAGGSYNAGKIYMVPLGVVDIATAVTHNSTSLPARWPTGQYTATITSMNGLLGSGVTVNPATYTVNMTQLASMQGCGYAGALTGFYAVALRNEVTITPDTTGYCGGGIPMWPIPGRPGQSPDLPVWGNNTEVNVTPNEVTRTYLNFTPGTYLQGSVYITNSSLSPKDFSVIAISKESTSMASYSYTQGTSPWACGGSEPAGGFCVPVPPGGFRLQASALGFPSNYTWGYAPLTCCYSPYEPIPMRVATSPSVSSINLTAPGAIYGHMFQAGTNLGVYFGSIVACPASPNAVGQQCDNGIVYFNGTFFGQAPLGWDSITASAAGFSPNTVWAYINGNVSVGNISMTPLATIAGQVVDPTGHPLYEANVHYCHVDATISCGTPLGSGISTSAGGYNGTVLGGWLPWTTYELSISAAGYTTDWVWVNTTVGNYTTAPTAVLYPLGTNTSVPVARGGVRGAAPAASTPAPTGVWVDGTLTDASTGYGVVTGSIQACPTNGGLCTPFTDGSNEQGYFNESVLSGLYYLNVSAAGYQPASVFFNATAAAVIHLGRILMYSWGWVRGNATIDPFGPLVNVLRSGSSTVHVEIPLAPGATVGSCNNARTTCGTSIDLSSIGNFAIQAPPGAYDEVTVNPSGGSVAGSIGGGFHDNVTLFNTTGNTSTFSNVDNTTTLLDNLTLTIYVMVAGTVYDASTLNPVTQTAPYLPARWVGVSVSTLGPNHANAATLTNGGGQYMFFLPPGPNQTNVSAVEQGSFVTNATSLHAPLNSSDPPTVLTMPPLNLTHYGWIELYLRTEGTLAPVPFTAVTAEGAAGFGNASTLSAEVTNQVGFVNVSSVPARNVTVTAGGQNDFNSTTTWVWVNESRTTDANASPLSPGPGTLEVGAWGWVRSAELNTTYVPDLPTVIDKVTGQAIPFVSVTVSSTDPSLAAGGSQPTSWSGQFLSDAPIGPADTLVFQHDSFLKNSSTISIKSGGLASYTTVNMTGVGILAGLVTSFPGNLPLGGANVQACPYGSTLQINCYSTETNASGLYWVAAVPGPIQLTVSEAGFVSNSSVIAQACSDCWTWVPTITLNEFAYVFGSVRGLPSGLALPGALVSVCSPLGNPVGPCAFTVGTSQNGLFILSAPAGRYVLNATDARFNTSYLPISLSPGEHLPVGTIFLQAFGQVTGTILSAATFQPVFNATVYGCPRWSGGACTNPVFTGTGGQYTFGGPPGPYTITVEALGFSDSYASTTLGSGINSTVPAILLTPLGTDLFYSVSGIVVNSSDPSQPIAGATVAAMANTTPAFSTLSASDGTFAFSVLYGTYNLSVAAPGFVASTVPLKVHSPISGLLVALSPSTFLVSGIARDALTNAPIADVEIQDQGSILATSASDGTFSFALANGSYSLTATYLGGGPVAYPSFSFSLVVNGAPQVHNLALAPPTQIVYGSVVDAVSGAPLSGAQVRVSGTSSGGIPVALTLTSNPAGGFSISLPVGNYSATATYSGYEARTVAFQSAPGSGPVSLLMTPVASVPGPSTAPSGASVVLALLGLVLVAIAAVAVLVVWRFRKGRDARPESAAPTAAGGGKR